MVGIAGAAVPRTAVSSGIYPSHLGGEPQAIPGWFNWQTEREPRARLDRQLPLFARGLTPGVNLAKRTSSLRRRYTHAANGGVRPAISDERAARARGRPRGAQDRLQDRLGGREARAA